MKKITKYLTNFNIISALIITFTVWLLFFDQDGYLGQQEIKLKIEKLQQQRDYYLDKIAADSNIIENIEDSAFLVRYARENFLFVEEGESLYLIEGDGLSEK
ncbi:MAG: hypothetical protein R3Y19_01650 [Rikenellaceae bacterium]